MEIFFNSPLVSNAGNSADEVGSLNLENVQSELNSAGLPDNVRKKVIQLRSRLTNLKAEIAQKGITDPAGIKVEVDKEIADFERIVVSDNSLSIDEKTVIFSFTIATRDNLDNVKDLLTSTNGGGRKGCFFCSFINVFVTIVVAVAVIAIAAVIIVGGVAAAIEETVALATLITAAAYEASVGAIIGVTYTVTNNCLDIVDYGQDNQRTQLGLLCADC